MKTIPIVILAEDIKNTEYTDNRDCAITRAIQRAGYPLRHGFSTVIVDQNSKKAGELPDGISRRVVEMYRHVHPDHYLYQGDNRPPEDIHTFITLTED